MIAEDYIARGVWPRHSELLPWVHPSGERFNRSEGDSGIGHMPFFASVDEAAGVKHWLTVAALPMDDEQIVYLDAGWVDGMLALRFIDIAQPMGDYDDISSVWGYTLAPMGAEIDVLGGGTGHINYHGAVGCVLLNWTPYALDYYNTPYPMMHHRLYIAIKASTVFFGVIEDYNSLGVWERGTAREEWDDDNRTPFARIPDLGGRPFSGFGLNYVFYSGNIMPWPDDLFDKSEGLTLANIHALWGLVMLYQQMAARDRALPHRTKQVASYTAALLPFGDWQRYRWLSIDVYYFAHCEHVYGCHQHLEISPPKNNNSPQ